jgi:2-isopropylmalate synthase
MDSPEKRIYIFDTTLRDGEQSPGSSMNPAEKLRIARQLEKMGVDIIEAGFPIASEGDFLSVQQIAQEIRGAQIAGLARANNADIDRAWEAIRDAANPRIHTFISSSDIHLKYQLRKSREQVLKEAVAAVAKARSYTPNVEFPPWTPPARIGVISAKWWRRSLPPGHRRSTSPIRWDTPFRRNSAN